MLNENKNAGLSVLGVLSVFPYLGRRTSEMFLKHSSKQLVVGETMPFQYYVNRVFGVYKILVNKRKPVFVLIFQKSNSHFFLEKSAEIAGLQVSDTGNLVQRYGTLIIFGNVIQNKVQPVKIFFLLA